MIEEIASNFFRMEIPLPDTLLRSVNSYVIRDSKRNLIIDTGLSQTLRQDRLVGWTQLRAAEVIGWVTERALAGGDRRCGELRKT